LYGDARDELPIPARLHAIVERNDELVPRGFLVDQPHRVERAIQAWRHADEPHERQALLHRVAQCHVV
jgi:hypothetical protein